MRLLVISLDQSLFDPSSRASKRQVDYFVGWSVDIIILCSGASRQIALSENIRVRSAGGSNKASALWRAYRLARRLARTQAYALVSAQDFQWTAIVAISSGVKRVYLQDHSEFFARPEGSQTRLEKLFLPCSVWLVKRATRVRSVSQRGAAGLVKLGIPQGSIDVIPVPTDIGRLVDIPPARFHDRHVLCVARFEWQKALDVLLYAWKHVIADYPDAQLRLLGDGSLRASLEQLADRLGIRSSVEFAGKKSDVKQDLGWSTLVVQPSRFEGWGLAVIEAAAARRFVIMTNVGCAGEVIKQGISGSIVPIEDVTALAQAIKDYLAAPEAYTSQVEQAYQITQRLPDIAATNRLIRDSYECAARD